MNSENLILLGLDNYGKKLFSNDYHHILLVAPVGYGKGVSFVIPNLFTFEESVIVHDIKLDNYAVTSGYRESIGHKIYVWNPLGEKDKTNRYNPLDFINTDKDKMVDDIQKIAGFLIKGQHDNKFKKYSTDAKNLFIAIVLYLIANPTKTKSLGEIARMVTGDLAHELSSGIDKSKTTILPMGYRIIERFLKMEKKEQSSIIRVLNHYLAPWDNPLIDYATSKSDFDIADFKKKKISLYVGLHPSEITRLQPLMQFFYEHAVDRLSYSQIPDDDKGGVCLIMDDFNSIGRIDLFKSTMPYLRGYRIKLFLISSNIELIEAVYGEADARSMMSCCAYKIAFTADDYENANKISKLCIDRSEHEELMSWEKIMNLPATSQILLRDHMQPIISNKYVYHEEDEMKQKILPPAKI